MSEIESRRHFSVEVQLHRVREGWEPRITDLPDFPTAVARAQQIFRELAVDHPTVHVRICLAPLDTPLATVRSGYVQYLPAAKRLKLIPNTNAGPAIPGPTDDASTDSVTAEDDFRRLRRLPRRRIPGPDPDNETC